MRVLSVLPDTDRVEERLLSEATQGRVLRADHLCTFADLVDRLSSRDRRLRADELLARAVLGACAQKIDLGPFSGVGDSPAFVRAARELIGALKAGRLSPDEFRKMALHLPARRQTRAAVLARLYQAYDEALARSNLCDADDELEAARMLADSSEPLPGPLSQLDAIHLEHLHDFSPARLELLLVLARRASRGAGPRLVVTLPFSGNARVNAFVEPAFRALEAQGQTLAGLEVMGADPAEGGGPGRALAAQLFRDPGSRLAPLDLGEAVRIVAAPTPDREAREVARRVRDRLDAGAGPGDIAIAVRRAGDQVERLVEQLERYGVPVRTGQGAPLLSAPPAQLAFALLELVDDGFPREGFAGLLRSRYVRGGEQGAARLFREAGVRDERVAGGYRERLAAFAARLRQASEEGRAERVERQAAAILATLDTLRMLPERAGVARHCQRLLAVLEDLGVARACQATSHARFAVVDPRALKAIARDQAAFEGLAALLRALPAAHELAGRSKEELSRRQFVRVLADAAGDALLRTRVPRWEAVRILDVRALVGRAVPHLFLFGMNDGIFPARPEPHPLFPEEDRALVNQAAGRSVFRAPSLLSQAEEPLLFHLALCSAQASVTLGYSRVDARGREALRSPFVDEVERACTARAEPSPLAPVPVAEACRSRDELLARASLERFAIPALRTGSPDPAASGPALEQIVAPREPAWSAIAQRVAMERERLQFFADPTMPAGRFTGLAAAPDLAAALARTFAFGPERPLTAKQLDELGRCAFKGFARRALRLLAPDEAGEDTDARTRGDVAHRVLEAFFQRMRQESRLPLHGGRDEQETFEEVAREMLEALGRALHVGHPELWRLRQGELLVHLRRAIALEQETPHFEGLVPARFEARFEGEETTLPIPSDDGSEQVHLGGKIDRVDEGAGKAAVLDYKSGKADALRSRLKDNLLVDEFQLVAYLALVRNVLKREVVDAAFFSLRDARLVPLSMVRKEPLDALLALDPEARKKLREAGELNLANRVWELVRQMRAGQFAIRPVDCRGCDYRAVCRIGTPSLPGDEP